MRRYALLFTKRAAVLAAVLAAGPAAADRYNATNGVFGAGSYVGSDHWFASFTQSTLIHAAARRNRRPQSAAKQKSSPESPLFVDPAPLRKSTAVSSLAAGEGASPVESDGLWVRPQPDESFKRPAVGAGYIAPVSDGEYRSPRSDGDYRAPTAGPGFISPQIGPGFVAPTVGPGLVRPRAAAARGRERILEKDLDGAIASFRSADSSRRGDREALQDTRFALGVALLARQQPRSAEEAFREALALNPRDARSRFMLGVSLLFRGEPAEAEAQLKECSADETDGLSLLMTGIARDLLGNAAGACEAYAAYLQRADVEEVRARIAALRALPN